MSEHAHYSRTVLAEAAGGRTFPSWEVTRAFVLACGGDEQEWSRRWAETERLLANGVVGSPPAGRRGHRPRRPLVAAGAIVLTGVAAFLGGFLPAHLTGAARSTFLGEVDLAGYCRSQGYSGVSLAGTTAVDWYCDRAPNVRDSLSVNEACRWQYRQGLALARYADVHNPDSWQCWGNVVVLGKVDLAGYCRAHGGLAAQPRAAGVWYCHGADRSFAIDDDSACRWQFGAWALVAGPASVHAPWEQWDCWG